jgi:hypothetical protein
LAQKEVSTGTGKAKGRRIGTSKTVISAGEAGVVSGVEESLGRAAGNTLFLIEDACLAGTAEISVIAGEAWRRTCRTTLNLVIGVVMAWTHAYADLGSGVKIHSC